MKYWNDQPDELINAQVLCKIYLKNRCQQLYVYKSTRDGWGYKENIFYVTIGNLFASQTIKCPNAESVFSIIEIAHNTKVGDLQTLPDGFIIIQNCEKIYE